MIKREYIMTKMIYYDYCAFMIIAVLLISMVVRKLTKGKMNSYFIWLLLISLITTTADILAVTLDNAGAGNIAAKYIFHTVYLVFHSLTTPMIIAYILALTDTWHKLESHKIIKGLLYIPISLVIVGMAANFYKPVIFYFDPNGAYTRGSMFFILYISAVLYICVGAYFIIRYRMLLNTQRFIAIAAIFPLMVGAIGIQMVKPGILIEMFANAVGLLSMALVIQRPEERMDSDTGFGNLNAFTDDMRKGFVSRKRSDVIILTIVNYQSIWEMLGYENTSLVLKEIAEKIENLFKKERVGVELYNLGRGDFAAVISGKGTDKTDFLAEKIASEMKVALLLDEMEVNLVANTCIAHCPENIRDVAQLLALEEDLHRNARSGDVLYASNLFLPDKYDMMKNMDRIIEQAIAEHKFEVYYQPIYSVKEQRFNSAEALLRLRDEKYGFISPEIFIPAAEKSGAIHRIGTYVLEEVCRFVGSEDYKTLGVDYIEINLSVQQCMQKNLAQEVIEMMNRYQVKPDQINLEITETAASYSQNIFIKNLKILEQAGVKFSLDDYGTGYSNMKRIVELPLHIVKIDKTFTAASEDERMRIVLQNSVRMIKDMNMKIVVEGVETSEMVDFFSNLECDYIQGYYYSKPIPKSDFVSFIMQNKGIAV